MMKILFVDDDAVARKSIVMRIPWEKNDWELIYCATDGVDALEYMKTNQPDIVLTDVKMPVMDGIQMASIAKEYYPDIKFIFLSGYKDFTYAQQAVKLNAVDYLTKPVEMEQMIQVLKKTEELLKKERKINKVVNKGYPELKRHYISQLMYKDFTGVEDKVFQAFDINLKNGLGVVAFLDIKWEGKIPEEAKMVLQEGCELFADKNMGSFFLLLDVTQIFIIYTASNTKEKSIFEQQRKELEENWKQFLMDKLKITGKFSFGSCFSELNDLYLSYQSALKVRSSQISDILYQVRNYIEQNYSDTELSLIQIAEHFNVNHCYLTSIYKEKFGVNLYDYLIQVRLEEAARLIRSGTLKSYEIAERVGYSNSQYFSLSFKKYFGCTTTEYKNRLFVS